MIRRSLAAETGKKNLEKRQPHGSEWRVKRVPKAFAPLLLAAAGALGCEVAGIEKIEPRGSAFTKALAVQYSELARREAGVAFDHIDAEYYARKARGAAQGDPVAPADPRKWGLRQAHLDQLIPAHRALLWVLDNFGRIKAPRAAARAQAGFDCWVERAEEDRDVALIRECRDRFRDGYIAIRNAIE